MVALGLILYWLAHAPWFIEKVATHFAPQYGMSYSRIYGNAITGLEIDDLAYHNSPLVKHIVLRWNPNTLIQKELSLDKVIVEEVQVDTLKSLVASFSRQETNSTHTTKPLAFGIKIAYLRVDLAPFIEQNMSISSTSLELKEAYYEENTLGIESIALEIDTDKSFDKLALEHIVVNMNNISIDTKAWIVEDGDLLISLISNIAKISYNAEINNNTIVGNLEVNATDKFYTFYDLPIRTEAIKSLNIELNASKKAISAKLNTAIPQLLKAKKGEFNFDIIEFNSQLLYLLEEGILQINSKAFINTPYAKDIHISNRFSIDEDIAYHGDIVIKEIEKIEGIESNLTKILDHLKVTYQGDIDSIDMSILSNGLKGTLSSKGFKDASLHLETKEAIVLREILSLPKELNQSKVHISIDVPLSLEANVTLKAKAKIRSNIMNIDSDISYDEYVSLYSRVSVPKDSLLKAYSKDIQWESLKDIRLEAQISNKEAKGIVSVGALSIEGKYALESSDIDAKISLGSVHSTIKGKVKNEVSIETNLSSISTALAHISSFYILEGIPKIEGNLKSNIRIKKMQNIEIKLSSSQINKVKNIRLDASIDYTNDRMSMLLNDYTFEYEAQKIFSTKVSELYLEDKNIIIDTLWLNDEVKIEANYSLERAEGIVTISSDTFHLSHKIIDLESMIHLKVSLEKNSIDISGNMTFLDAQIHYDLSEKHFASDSDIIILKHKNSHPKSSPFMDTLSLNINIDTEKPLVYKQGNINIKTTMNLGLYKSKGTALMLLGSVKLLKGGTYDFEGKKFILNQSFVYFTGAVNKALLDISVRYKSLNHLINIRITGMPSSPNIQFTAIPSLSKEAILSILLFDSQAGAGTNSGKDMMKMMGGVMAKSLLSNFGIHLDSVVFGEGNSIEIGKQLTDKITMIYINDSDSIVKVNYQHSKYTQSVIEASEVSQSYDIVYKRDF